MYTFTRQHQNLFLWDAYEKYIANDHWGVQAFLLLLLILTLYPRTACNESKCVQELVFSCRYRCQLDGISLYSTVAPFHSIHSMYSVPCGYLCMVLLYVSCCMSCKCRLFLHYFWTDFLFISAINSIQQSDRFEEIQWDFVKVCS